MSRVKNSTSKSWKKVITKRTGLSYLSKFILKHTGIRALQLKINDMNRNINDMNRNINDMNRNINENINLINRKILTLQRGLTYEYKKYNYYKVMEELTIALNKNDTPYHLTYSTLLQVMREGIIKPTSLDIDIAIDPQDIELLKQELSKNPHFVFKEDRFMEVNNKEQLIQFKYTNIYFGVNVDISIILPYNDHHVIVDYPWHIKGSNGMFFPFSAIHKDSFDIVKIKQPMFFGKESDNDIEVKVPKDFDKELTDLYGKNWKNHVIDNYDVYYKNGQPGEWFENYKHLAVGEGSPVILKNINPEAMINRDEGFFYHL